MQVAQVGSIIDKFLPVCTHLELGTTSGIPDYGFPAYFCHSKHVLHRKTLLSQTVVRKLKPGTAIFRAIFFFIFQGKTIIGIPMQTVGTPLYELL